MCLIIINKKGVIKERYLYNAWISNFDGAGMSAFIDGKLIIKKFKNFNKFLKSYNEIRKSTKGTVLLHFRLATAGDSETTRNLMPFKINNELAFAHNGHMSALSVSNVYSDSYIMAKMLGSIYNKVGIEGIIEILKRNYGQKFALLTKDTCYHIGNFHLHEGNIYSNHSYESYLEKKMLSINNNALSNRYRYEFDYNDIYNDMYNDIEGIDDIEDDDDIDDIDVDIKDSEISYNKLFNNKNNEV